MSGDAERCRSILRRGSKSFYAASLLLPRRVRESATVFYAFCRIADDAVDDSEAPKQAIEMLRFRLDHLFAGRPQPHPVDRALSHLVARYDLPRVAFDALIEGFVWDAEGRRYRTLSDLYGYCVRVASTVGVVMTILMGERRPEVLARACDLGVAMQLTNIARDVGEDAARGRYYLPTEWAEESGFDLEAWLRAPTFSAQMRLWIERLLREAQGLYERSEVGISDLPPSCRPAILAARRIYADIGARLAAQGYDSISQRAYTPPLGKALRLIEAFAGAFLLPPSSPSPLPPLPEAAFLIEGVQATRSP